MSAFIDILFRTTPANFDVPFRVFNKPWKNKTINHTVIVGESFPESGCSVLNDLYAEYNNESISLWILGELYSYRQVRLIHGREKIIDAITLDFANGTFDPILSNGHFVIILHDKRQGTWWIYTDRLGTYHLYYGSNNGRRALGTFYRSVIKSVNGSSIDQRALLSYFAFGFFWNNETFIKEIILLQPSSVYQFDASLNLIEGRSYWTPRHTVGMLTYSEAIDQFASCIEDVTKDLTANGRIAIPISGGLDSRTMAGACTLPSIKNREFWSYSYGYTNDSVEISIAKKIAEARKLPFTSHVVSNYLFDLIDSISDSVELFQYVDGTRQADITKEMERHADFVIAAHWGDVWFDSMGLNQSEGDLVGFGVKKLKKRGSDWLLRNVLGLDEKKAEEELREKVAGTLAQFSQIEDNDFKIKMLKTFSWSYRWTLASIRMFQPGAFPRIPFYDTRVIDYFATIPTDYVKGRKLQIDYLKRYHPDLASITWQEYGTNLYLYEKFNNRMLLYKVLAKLNRTLMGRKVIYRNWEVFYLNKDGRSKLEENILANKRIEEFVKRDSIVDLINQFYADPSPSNGYSISMLHTFSLFLKKYLD